jgi:electron transfer flavoprotein alpha subunit
MAGTVLVVGEAAEDGLTRLSGETATLGRALAEAAGLEAVGLVVAPNPGPVAEALAAYLPRVLAVEAPELSGEVPAPQVAAEVRALMDDVCSYVVIGASQDGRDVAGTLVGLTSWPILAGAAATSWTDDGLLVEAAVLAGKAITQSRFTGDRGIITVRPSTVEAVPAAVPGTVETRASAGGPAVPAVPVLDRVAEAGAEASLEEARVVVVGGRGVGGPEGFGLVEELAGLVGGVVGATRAAVDAGWIPYARQVGQTGKLVKPALYLGLGVSGAMQHRVGMQSADTIIIINRDPDAPMREIADLFVVGDLFEVGPALVAELRARRG